MPDDHPNAGGVSCTELLQHTSCIYQTRAGG